MAEGVTPPESVKHQVDNMAVEWKPRERYLFVSTGLGCVSVRGLDDRELRWLAVHIRTHDGKPLDVLGVGVVTCSRAGESVTVTFCTGALAATLILTPVQADNLAAYLYHWSTGGVG